LRRKTVITLLHKNQEFSSIYIVNIFSLFIVKKISDYKTKMEKLTTFKFNTHTVAQYT